MARSKHSKEVCVTVALLLFLSGASQGQRKKPTTEIMSDLASKFVPERFDEKTVPWNATLVNKGDNDKQLAVIVDLRSISPLQVVKSLSVTIEFFQGATSLGTTAFDFPIASSGVIFGGKKVEHFFELKDGRFSRPGVSIKPLHFDGSVDTHILANQESIDRAGKA